MLKINYTLPNPQKVARIQNLTTSKNFMIYLKVLKEAPALFKLLDTMVGKRFDAAAPWVPVQTLCHWTGGALAVLFGKIL